MTLLALMRRGADRYPPPRSQLVLCHSGSRAVHDSSAHSCRGAACGSDAATHDGRVA
jgi:hypothetical protein